MRLLFSLFLIVIWMTGHTQVEKKLNIYTEKFGNKKSDWPLYEAGKKLVNGEIARHSASIEQGQYLISLDAKAGLSGSIMPFPKKFVDLNAHSQGNYEIKFDYGVTLQEDSTAQLGLVWDKHDVSASCKDGKFYMLKIVADIRKDSIAALVTQRSECNGQDAVVVQTQTKVLLLAKNKFSIRRLGTFYSVFINDQLVLNFNFSGNFNLSNLFIDRGAHYLDNVQMQLISYEEDTKKMEGLENVKKPNIYLLMAGIETYDHPNNKQRKLKVCLDDVDSMYGFWTNLRGGSIPSSNIRRFLDTQATVSNLTQAAIEFFSKATANDYVIFYFTGHGNQGGFVAYDGLLEYEKLNVIIRNAPANKLFVVDACHAGSWNASSSLAEKGKRMSEKELLDAYYRRLANIGTSVNWLLSCEPTERSFEDSKNGFFTAFLLEGLNGKANMNKDQFVELSEVYYYLKSKFNQWNDEHKDQFTEEFDDVIRDIRYIPKRQNPKMIGSNGSFPMSIIID